MNKDVATGRKMNGRDGLITGSLGRLQDRRRRYAVSTPSNRSRGPAYATPNCSTSIVFGVLVRAHDPASSHTVIS